MAQLKNTNISDTGNLSLPQGTTAQRPGSPVAGMIRYNTTVSDTEYYDGAAWRSISDSNPEATGGTIVDTDIGGVAYRIHLFTTVGNSTFTVTKGGEVEYLIVGGGGSGGNDHGGGGGGGGLIQGTTTVTPQVYTITVGAGAASAPAVRNNTTSRGTNGGTSSAFGLTAFGGGGGGGSSGSTSSNGSSGGSGGGSSGYGSPRTPGLGTSGQGNNGGTGGNNAPDYQGAGGGGAGAQGANGANPGVNSYGGTGIASSISGNLQFYAGGGGGSSSYTSSNGAYGSGGAGGGGHGATNNLTPIIPLSPAKSGVPNTGGGGGGANRHAAGGSQHLGPSIGPSGSGGSGIVIIRYRKNASTVTSPDQVGISSLPFTSGLEDALISKTRLLVYLDANNQTSNPGTGTAWNDLSGNGYNGLLQNGPSFNNSLPKSVRFDGLNDYIQFTNPSNRWAWTPSDIGNNTLCFELWVKSTDTSGLYISRPWNGSGQYNYTLNASSLGLQAGSTSASRVFSTLATGNWEYICVILTPTQVGIYRNGYINSAFSNHGMSGGVPSSGNANQPLVVMTLYPYGGSWAGLEGFSILGEVGVFRSYNRILSPAEVLSNYDAQKLRFRS